MKRYKAKYIISGGSTLEDCVLSIDAGRVIHAGPGEFDEDLGDVAVVPGVVNAHSHAFQRLIRGRTEYLSAERPTEDFWSWRNQMYSAAGHLDPDGMEVVARMTFLEMLMSGITAVGEFHYVHHQPNGAAYSDPNLLAKRVIRAARTVGLRINLLSVAYSRGGYGRPASAAQGRFTDPSLSAYLDRTQTLSDNFEDDEQVQVGFAPHSIRAVPKTWLEGIALRSRETGQMIHIHACEQRRELEESIEEHGLEPIELFHDVGLLGAQTTLVHATHLNARAIELIAASKTMVCACPTTERNLGDGFLPAQALLGKGIRVSLGSDSHAQINLWEDARLVEYHERLREERRNVLAAQYQHWSEPSSDRVYTADLLWPMLNEHGSAGLGLETGQLTQGQPADFSLIDLNDLSLAGTHAESLKTDLVFSLNPQAIRTVYVAGEPVLQDRHHPDADQIISDYRRYVSSFV